MTVEADLLIVGAPVGSPAASRSIRPRGGSGVARVIPASSRARPLTQAL